jgi:hypothetical protein
MGTNIDRNTLRAMLLEILLKDKILLKEILQVIAKEDPQLLEEFTAFGSTMLAREPSVAYEKTGNNAPNPENEGVSDEELNFWVDKHFTEFDSVFKALA